MKPLSWTYDQLNKLNLDKLRQDLLVFQKYDIHNKAREYLETAIYTMEGMTPCQWCTGQIYVISQSPDSILWIQGSHLGVNMGPTIKEHIVSLKACPNCGRIFQKENNK